MSEKLLADVHQSLGDAAPEKIAIAPMGGDIVQAQRARPCQPCRAGQPCRIYSCGRLHPVKGHKYLFEALALLAAKGYPVKLQVAGGEEGVAGGGYKDGLVQQLRELGL